VARSTFAKPHPHSALRADQLKARLFEGALNDLQGGAPGDGPTPFKQSNCLHPDASLIGQLLLGPGKKSTGGAALCWREHAA
jgi:hypothetical protein